MIRGGKTTLAWVLRSACEVSQEINREVDQKKKKIFFHNSFNFLVLNWLFFPFFLQPKLPKFLLFLRNGSVIFYGHFFPSSIHINEQFQDN